MDPGQAGKGEVAMHPIPVRKPYVTLCDGFGVSSRPLPRPENMKTVPGVMPAGAHEAAAPSGG